jgi:hypothetical protein
MTYAIIAYVLSLLLWIAYLTWVSARFKRALGDQGGKR